MYLKKTIKKILELSGNTNTLITVVDVGAADGYNRRRWDILGRCLKVVGFEPNEIEFKKLRPGQNVIWINKALGAENKEYPLFITKHYSNVSLFKPNFKLIEKLACDSSGFEIVKEEKVKCEQLDKVSEENKISIDAVKLDTQGSELDILKGARKALFNDVFSLEIEVEFAELYENQPLSGDIDKYLSDYGFQLMDYGNLTYMKGKNSIGIAGNKGQLIAADALYFKSLDFVKSNIQKINFDKFINMILICIVYGYYDYALEVCMVAKEKKVYCQDIIEKIIKILRQKRMFVISKLNNKSLSKTLLSIFRGLLNPL